MKVIALIMIILSIITISKEGTISTLNIKEDIPSLSTQQLSHMLKDNNIFIIDTRELESSTKDYIKNTILIPLSMNKFLPFLIKYDSKIVLITEVGKEQETINAYSSLSYQNIIGYLKGGIQAWITDGRSVSPILYEPAINMQLLLDQSEKIIDVREIEEYRTDGIIKDTQLLPLSEIILRFNEIPKKHNLFILCRSGARAAIITSYLIRQGIHKKISVIEGGCNKLKELGYIFIDYELE